MRDARPYLILASAALALSLTACAGEQEPEENQVITDINAADPGEIEAVPPDESVDPLPADDSANGVETGGGEEVANTTDANLG